jgi:uncharacterized protein YdaU (DUF1376 family)
VNYYTRHCGDWVKKTSHLSLIEEGAYSRMCDWCYINERPLPHTEREVCAIARAVNPAERKAALRVLHAFFTLAEDGWHQSRIDKVLAEYADRVRRDTNNPNSQAERARRYRDRRAVLFKRLGLLGINPAFNTPNARLEQILVEMGEEVNPRPVTRDVTVTQREPSQRTDTACTTNPFPNSRDVTDGAATSAVTLARDGAAAAGVADPTLTGRAMKQIRLGGFTQGNSADPRFITLVQQGVTDDEWRLTAAEAVARTKGWGWLLATIIGRRQDVAAGLVPPRPAKAPKRDEHERVASLTPTIAAKRGIPF